MSAETEPYRPSNGSEGDGFRDRWCDRCEKDRYESRPCSIFGRSMAYQVTDKEYPKQWVRDKGPWPGNPRCTAFVEIGTRPRAPRTLIRDKRQEALL